MELTYSQTAAEYVINIVGPLFKKKDYIAPGIPFARMIIQHVYRKELNWKQAKQLTELMMDPGRIEGIELARRAIEIDRKIGEQIADEIIEQYQAQYEE